MYMLCRLAPEGPMRLGGKLPALRPLVIVDFIIALGFASSVTLNHRIDKPVVCNRLHLSRVVHTEPYATAAVICVNCFFCVICPRLWAFIFVSRSAPQSTLILRTSTGRAPVNYASHHPGIHKTGFTFSAVCNSKAYGSLAIVIIISKILPNRSVFVGRFYPSHSIRTIIINSCSLFSILFLKNCQYIGRFLKTFLFLLIWGGSRCVLKFVTYTLYIVLRIIFLYLAALLSYFIHILC